MDSIDDAAREMASVPHPEAGEKDLLGMLLDGDVTVRDLKAVRKLESVIKTRNRFWERLDDIIEKVEQMQSTDDDTDDAGDTVPSAPGLSAAVAWGSFRASSAAAHWARIKHRVLSAHPRYEHYPPSPDRLAAGGVAIAVWLLFMTTVILPDVTSGVLAGDAQSIGLVLIALLTVGAYAVEDLPTRSDL